MGILQEKLKEFDTVQFNGPTERTISIIVNKFKEMSNEDAVSCVYHRGVHLGKNIAAVRLGLTAAES